MKKYNKYKSSGIKWIGDIPEHWDVNKIKHIALIQGRIGFKGYSKSDLVYEGEGALTIGAKHIKDNNLSLTDPEYLSWEKYYESPEIMVEKGQILITQRGSLGKVAIIKEDIGKATINPSMLIIKNVVINNEFLYHYFTNNIFNVWLEIVAGGTAVPMISQEQLYNFPVITPPKPEQTQIAAYLNKKTTQIDQTITQKEKLIELYEEEKKATINQAVTKGLNKNVKLTPSGIEWLGDIPEHWEVKKFKYVGKIINGYAFNSKEFADEGARVLKISNIQTMRIDWSESSFIDEKYYDDLENFVVEKGDIVFALTRPIISSGIKAAIMDLKAKILLNQRNAMLKPFSFVENKWLYYIILAENFIEHFDSIIDKTGQQPNISSTDIGNISVPIPTKKEQTYIVQHIEEQRNRLNQAITKAKKEIELIKEYRQALIFEAVTGKIDVREETV